MDIYSLNVGQGQFVVVRGDSEAFIVDTFVPLNPGTPIPNVKGALATALAGRNLIGLILTGFDSDHFCQVGLKIVLNKYRPNWIAYPRYRKRTQNADACFGVIDVFDQQKKIQRISVDLSDNIKRVYNSLSTDFSFEVFSPHAEDMTSSNNCSLVVKITERSSGRTYLVTGDTELPRWDSILRIFGGAIKSDILAAPHHGSRNGVSQSLLDKVAPHTVLISAGVKNQYGHPDPQAIALYSASAQYIYATNGGVDGVGQSLRTAATATGITTSLFTFS